MQSIAEHLKLSTKLPFSWIKNLYLRECLFPASWVQLKMNFVAKAYPSFGDTEQVPPGGERKLTPKVTDAFVLLGEKPA